MDYTSVAQILDTIDETRQRLFATVEGLTEERQNARPAQDTWSARDIVEHLTITEDRLVRLMGVMLAKAEGVTTLSMEQPVKMEPFNLDPFIERARVEKFTAPEAIRPGSTDPISDLLVRMRRSREDLRALRPRIEAIDLSSITYPHPAFGPLNFYQWLAFIGVHEERHLRQINSVLSA